MNRRLYFVLPDIKSARRVWKEMLLACVDNRNIHFLTDPGTPLGKMQPADTMERTDMFHEGIAGIFVGAALGLMAGVLALLAPDDYFPMWYTNLHWTGILTITIAIGAICGAAGMAMLGICLANTDLEAAREKISHGQVMMIVTLPMQRLAEIRRIMQVLHPEAEYYGVWPALHPVFP